jgi:hypothetical protein
MSPLLLRWTKLAVVAAALCCLGYGAWMSRESLPRFRLPTLGGAAKIVAVPPEIDFRNPDGKSNATVDIVLRNEGGAAAKLLEIKASCGCTALQMPAQNVIPPGGEVRLPVQLQLPSYGKKDSVVTVTTDAAGTPSIRIPLILHGAKLTPPYLSHAPETIRVESVLGTTPPPRTFQVNCVEAPGEQWLTGFTASGEEISFGPPKLIREIPFDESSAMKEYEMEITFADSPSAESEIVIPLRPVTASEPVKPFPPLAVRWHRVASIRPVPASMLVRFDDDTAESSRRIALISADDSEWKIESIDSDAGWVAAAERNPAGEAKPPLIEVTASRPTGWDGATLEGQVRVRTSHPTCPEVVIRVIASSARS